MQSLKNIFAIIGSASESSSSEIVMKQLEMCSKDCFQITFSENLKSLPHFDPSLSSDNPPESIIKLRNQILQSDGVIICTPEYIFSIPSGLKNMIECCVATTVFEHTPTAIIVASADGKKAMEELQLIMKILSAHFNSYTTLLIQGTKGKINKEGAITDLNTLQQLKKMVVSFKDLIEKGNQIIG